MSSVVARDAGLRLDAATGERILRLMARAASAVDDAEFEVWPTLFTVDGEYRITTRADHDRGRDFGIWYCANRDMLEDRVAAIRSVNVYEPHVYRHVLGPTEVLAHDGAFASCVTPFLVARTGVDGEMILFSAGRYVDTVVFEGQRALFRSRVVVCDSARFDTLVALPI